MSMSNAKDEAKAANCLFTVAGIKVETVRSSSGDIARLVDYIPNFVQYGFGWVPGVLLRGSVWSLPGNLAQSVLAVVWCLAISQMYSQECDSPTRRLEYHNTEQHQDRACGKMVSPGPYLKVITFGRAWCATLVAFVVGGFVAVNIARWARKRGTYGLLCGKTREQLICAAAFIQPAVDECDGDDRRARALELRKFFGRYAVMALEFAIHKSRGTMDADQTRLWLEGLELLEGEEWSKMIPGDRHTTCYFWLLAIVRQALHEKLIHAEVASELINSIKAARGAANDMMDMLPNAMPYPYVQVVTFLVKSHVFLCSTEFGMILANAKHEPVFANGVPASFVVLMLAVVWMVNTYMQGLVDLHIILHNPFLNDLLGISHEKIAGGISRLRKELMEQNFCFPDLASGKGPYPEKDLECQSAKRCIKQMSTE